MKKTEIIPKETEVGGMSVDYPGKERGMIRVIVEAVGTGTGIDTDIVEMTEQGEMIGGGTSEGVPGTAMKKGGGQVDSGGTVMTKRTDGRIGTVESASVIVLQRRMNR